MERVNDCPQSQPVVPKVLVKVVRVDENVMRLESMDEGRVGGEEMIQISSTVLATFLPRALPPTGLTNEFSPGDTLVVDVRPDSGRFVPVHVHAMQFIREGGTRLVSDGLLVNVSEYNGPLIRSAYLPDFVFTGANLDTTKFRLRVGASVLYEVVSASAGQINGLHLRVIAEDAKLVTFPVYRGLGTIVLGTTDGVPYIRSHTPGGDPTLFPVHESAHHGCGGAISSLVGQKVLCTVCPKDPRQDSEELEVVFFEPTTEGLRQMVQQDGVHCMGDSINSRLSYREVQCSRVMNRRSVRMLRDAFLFLVEHAKADKFQRFVEQFPRFTQSMVEELGLDRYMEPDGIQTTTNYEEFLRAVAPMMTRSDQAAAGAGGDEASYGERERVPTTPKFTSAAEIFGPTEVVTGNDYDQLEEAAAALPITRPSLVPRPSESFEEAAPVRAEGSRLRQESSVFGVEEGGDWSSVRPSSRQVRAADISSWSNHGDSRPSSPGFVSFRDRLVERARPIESLSAGGGAIEIVGRTRIDMPSREEAGSGARVVWPSSSGGVYRSVGKVKPG